VLAIVGSGGLQWPSNRVAEIIDFVFLPVLFLPNVDRLLETHRKIALRNRVVVIDILAQILEAPATVLDREELV
jgi:DNA-binding winged helix-turn-helix (wHTH) protein